MNAITANASAGCHRKLPSMGNLAHTLTDFIAPRDHAGKGNWSKEADIPLWAWPAAIALSAFFLFGPQALAWLLQASL